MLCIVHWIQNHQVVLFVLGIVMLGIGLLCGLCILTGNMWTRVVCCFVLIIDIDVEQILFRGMED